MTQNTKELLNSCHDFNGIPYIEKIVPFPNFHTVLLQHVQLNSERVIFKSDSLKITVRELKNAVDALTNIFLSRKMKPGDKLEYIFTASILDYVYLLAFLDFGFRVKISFNSDDHGQSRIRKDNGESFNLPNIRELLKLSVGSNNSSDIPFVTLDSPAIIYDIPDIGELTFTQYNIMAAAQSLGKVFSLFRPGDALLSVKTESITQLMHGFFTPYYWGKTLIFFDYDLDKIMHAFKNKDLQYAYLPELKNGLRVNKGSLSSENLLRDAMILTEKNNINDYPDYPFQFIDSSECFCGMGPIYNSPGFQLRKNVPGMEIIEKDNKLFLRGHSLFHSVTNADKSNLIKYLDNLGVDINKFSQKSV